MSRGLLRQPPSSIYMTTDPDIRYELKPRQAVSGADTLIEMKKTKPVWEVIAKAIDIWADTHPIQWESVLIDTKYTRETRKDKKFGTSKTKASNLRYTLDMPLPVSKMIRALYNPDELPMDRKFFIKFARKFPAFKIAEKM